VGAPPGDYYHVRTSPDGAELALEFDEDVWIYETTRGTFNRVTTTSGNDRYPVWTPDGDRLVFASQREGSPELFWTLADGMGSPERLVTRDRDLFSIQPEGWTPDGSTRRLHFWRTVCVSGWKVDRVPLELLGTA
jgi:Tol biopolymer transport system component